MNATFHRLTLAAAALTSLSAFAAAETRLNDDAVTDESGALVVLGTGASSAYYSKEKAFDGDPSTYFDASQSAGTWCGLQMKTPKVLTRVTYRARTDTERWGYGRMRGCYIQGANKANFSDAVTLITIAPPADWKGDTYAEQTVTKSLACTYFRLYAPEAYDTTKCTACCGGNVAELNFFGNDAPTAFAEALLNDCAVTDESSAPIVLGTWANEGYKKENAFDGDSSTFFDAGQNAGTWCGLQMTAPKILTRVEYCARSDAGGYRYGYGRMVGCYIQGANKADFSDAVTLLTINPPTSWTGSTFNSERVTNPVALTTPFTYFRLYAPEAFDKTKCTPCCGGNVAELRLYGNDLPTEPVADPLPPALTFSGAINGVASVRIVRTEANNIYELLRQYAGEETWTSLGTVAGGTTDTAWLHGSTSTERDATYRVRAHIPGATADTDWTLGTFHALKGTASGTTASSATYAYSTVWDGKPETFFDASSANDAWTGLDLGTTRTVTGLRYVRRDGGDGQRIRGAYFQIANLADYSDAVTFYTVPTETVPAFAVITVTLDTPVSGRYVRYHSPASGYGNIAECEFDTTPHPTEGPTGVAVAYSDLTNQYARITWTENQPFVDETVVWRATAATGPWTKLATLDASARAYTDATCLVGIRYWYALSHNRVTGGETYEGNLSTPVAYRRLMRLERDWSNLTTLKSGVTLIKAYGTATSGSGLSSAGKLFDGDASTFADIYNGSGDTGTIRVGVDLGAKYAVGMIRVLPRQNGDGKARAPNYQLFGADDYTTWQGAGIVPKMTFNGYELGEFASTNTTPYRCFWLNKPEGGGYMNIAELELYGWPEDTLQAPTDLAFARTAAGERLTWTGCAAAVGYRVERAPEAEETWTALATLAETTYEDTSAPRDGSRVRYRVVAISATGDELATSAQDVVPYAPGTGTGLTGVATWPWYRDTYATPQAVVTNTAAGVNFNWGAGAIIPGVADATDNVAVTWTGRLIVPYTGVYTFSYEADNYFALKVDGAYLLNSWGLADQPTNVVVNLTAGEHAVRIDYAEVTGDAFCRLRWGGAVTEEVIPATQFVPTAPDDLAPWEGNRSFGAGIQGEATVAEDGSILIHSFAGDLGGSENAYHYLWQRITGDFDMRMTVENLGTGTKVMLMARAALDASAPFIATSTDSSIYKFGIKRRMTTGATILDATTPWTASNTTKATLRLVRVGNTFTSSYRPAGQTTWNLLESFTFADGAFGSEVFIGPASTANNSTDALNRPGHKVTHWRNCPFGLRVIVR